MLEKCLVCLAPFGECGSGHNSSSMDQGSSLKGNLDTHGLTPVWERMRLIIRGSWSTSWIKPKKPLARIRWEEKYLFKRNMIVVKGGTCLEVL